MSDTPHIPPTAAELVEWLECIRALLRRPMITDFEVAASDFAPRLLAEAEAAAKLRAFKAWVHAYLDAQGVPKEFPDGPHTHEGCRIGDRMDWWRDRLAAAESGLELVATANRCGSQIYERERAKHLAELASLRAAIGKHHAQRADDRCWMDDAELYKVAGLEAGKDRFEVGSREAMLKNCEWFVQTRCVEGGPWVSYADLEKEVQRLKNELNAYKVCFHGALDEADKLFQKTKDNPHPPFEDLVVAGESKTTTGVRRLGEECLRLRGIVNAVRNYPRQERCAELAMDIRDDIWGHPGHRIDIVTLSNLIGRALRADLLRIIGEPAKETT